MRVLKRAFAVLKRKKMACVNVQGCNEPLKHEFLSKLFEEREMDVFLATYTRFKGKKEFKFYTLS